MEAEKNDDEAYLELRYWITRDVLAGIKENGGYSEGMGSAIIRDLLETEIISTALTLLETKARRGVKGLAKIFEEIEEIVQENTEEAP